MSRQFHVVPEQRPLEQIVAVTMTQAVVDQVGQGSGGKENVTVDAEHEFTHGLAKDEIAHGGALAPGIREVAVIGNPRFEILQRLGAASGGIVVDDQKLHVIEDFRMIEADGLDGEIEAVIVVVNGGADGEEFFLAAPGGRRNRVAHFEFALEEVTAAAEDSGGGIGLRENFQCVFEPQSIFGRGDAIRRGLGYETGVGHYWQLLHETTATGEGVKNLLAALSPVA